MTKAVELIPQGETLERLIYEIAVQSRPLERLSVVEAAEKYVFIKQLGSYVGKFQGDYTPYMIEPTNLLNSTAFTGLVFCGPVQCGKTQIIQSWLAHSVMTDPADMAIFQMTKAQAADFTTRRIDRLHRDSPEIGSRVAPGAAADGQHRKIYLNGMILTITWPSATEFASKSIPRLFLTDYDRMPMDVEGEGAPYDLAAKRATTFRRNAMTVAESTPSFPILDPRWSLTQERPHEAPPCEGILGLYNRGDRRRWNWRCVSCKGVFEPDFTLMKWPNSEDLLECAEQAYMPCPHCGQVYEHNSGDVPGKNELNLEHSKWLIEGQTWTEDGQIIGVPNRSKIASFWLKGPAARFQTWEDIVFAYLKAEEAYESRGDETYLQTTVNTQQALPYRPKHTERLRMPEDLRDRARDFGEKEVPDGVRFLVACVDVQKNRFVVQVHGIGLGGDKWIVDRFDVVKSKRPDEKAGGFMWVNPGAYSEDWLELVDAVLLKSYPLGDASGRRMPIKITLCDSGGSAGVTKNAYDFYRTLRSPAEGMDIPPGLAPRFLLVAGRPSLGAPRLRIGFPDSKRKDRFAGARGEIPVGFLHSDMLKNELDGALDRTEPYGGRINFPLWLDNNFYTELTVEVKNEKGKWENPNGYRNESWDLLTYCLAACIHPDINIEVPDFWENPPGWAEEWDRNLLVFDETTGNTMISPVKDEIDFEKLGEEYG